MLMSTIRRARLIESPFRAGGGSGARSSSMEASSSCRETNSLPWTITFRSTPTTPKSSYRAWDSYDSGQPHKVCLIDTSHIGKPLRLLGNAHLSRFMLPKSSQDLILSAEEACDTQQA